MIFKVQGRVIRKTFQFKKGSDRLCWWKAWLHPFWLSGTFQCVFWDWLLLYKFLKVITLCYLWVGNIIFTGFLPPWSCCVYVVDNCSNVWNKNLKNLCSQLNVRSFKYFLLTPPSSLWEVSDGQNSVWMAVENYKVKTLTSGTCFAGKIRVPVKKLWWIVDIFIWGFFEYN